MPTKKEQNAKRQAELKKRRADAGLVRVEVWSTKENAQKIKDFAQSL